MQIIRKFMTVVAITFGLALPVATVITLTTATSAMACDISGDRGCYRESSGVVFRGDRVLPRTIEVTVCNPYLDQYDIGTLRGVRTRWWGPVMRYVSQKHGAWYGDLEILTQECKTYWVLPGTEIRVFADCIDALITTGRMTRAGTFNMRPKA